MPPDWDCRSGCALRVRDSRFCGTTSVHPVTRNRRHQSFGSTPFPQQSHCFVICRPVDEMPAVPTKENAMSSTSEDEEEPVIRQVRKKSRVEETRVRGRTGGRGGDAGHRPESSPSSQAYSNLVQQYQGLAEELSNLDMRPENTVQNARRATALIDQADVLADRAYNSSGSAAATYDGEFMNVAGHVVPRIAETMEVDSRSFSVRDFAACLKQLISGSRNAVITKTGLCDFSRNHCRIRLTASAPVLKFVHGAHDFTRKEVTAETPRPAPRKRTRLVVPPTKTHAADIRTEESLRNVDKDKTVIEVEKLHAEIGERFKSNGRKALPYLTIVVDPTDFGKTVENVFHFSFLVKEGYDRVITHNGLTSVVPVAEAERKTSKSSDDRKQLLFSFSQKDWLKWCDKIKEPKYRIG